MQLFPKNEKLLRSPILGPQDNWDKKYISIIQLLLFWLAMETTLGPDDRQYAQNCNVSSN